MVFFAHVDYPAHVVTRIFVPFGRLPTEVENLSAQRQFSGDVPLDEPAKLPIILIARARICPVAAAAIGRPRSPAFLKP